MMVLAFGVAVAGTLADLQPLPPCGDDRGQQLALLGDVRDLAVHGGDLWVADAGGLTRRSPDTLELRAVVEPGTHAWSMLDVQDGSVYARVHDINWWSDGRRGNGRPQSSSPKVDAPLETWLPVEAWPPPVNRRGRVWLETFAQVRGAPVSTHPRVVATVPQGTVVVTRQWVGRVSPEGQLEAFRWLVPGTDAAGIVQDRLFTVSDLRLEVWSGTGDASWQLPGEFTSAVERDGELLAATAAGQLLRLNLENGDREVLGCLLDSCSEAPAIPPRPRAHRDPDVYGPRVVTWAAELWRLGQAHQPRPVQLVDVDGYLVVAELHPHPWQEHLHAVVALRVFDETVRQVARIELPAPAAGTVQVLPSGMVTVGSRAWHVPSLREDHATAQEGRGFRWASHDEDMALFVGTWSGRDFNPAPGLPPRLAPQPRTVVRGVVVGDRFVLSGWTGPTEVWCFPSMTGPVRTHAPGLLAVATRGRLRALKRAENGAAHPRPAPEFRLTTLGQPLPKGRGATKRRRPALYLQARSARSARWREDVAKLRSHRLPLVVVGSGPAPADLPRGVRWVRSRERWGTELMLVHGGVVVWQGPVQRFDPARLRTRRKGAVDPELAAEWRERWRAEAPPEDEALQALIGQAVPLDEVAWETGPSGSTVFVGVDVAERGMWNLADETGVDAALVVTNAHVTPRASLAWGRWPESAAFPIPSRGSALVVDGRIRWVWAGLPSASALEWALAHDSEAEKGR